MSETVRRVAASESGEQPFAAAVELTRRLFSVQRVPLGVEHSLETGPRPCGLWVTDERARFVRRGMIEMLNLPTTARSTLVHQAK